jgi:hypothetical protein
MKQILVVVAATCIAASACSGTVKKAADGPSSSSSTPVPTSASAAPSGKPETTVQAAYPPRTFPDFQAFYGEHAADQITLVSDESVGLPRCNQHQVAIIVPTAATPEAIAGALSSAYVNAGMANGIVAAYHTQAEVDAGQGFTVGKLERDTPCAQGTNSLEIDLGSVTSYKVLTLITSGLPSGS